ncbi:response regulator [Ferrovum sp.]|uniref:response regulator n=1 Tax=Ferrovum sp. TaxID=2609467 RepID=UPI0026327927|nr:response regulator [Ferrovum sp.]
MTCKSILVVDDMLSIRTVISSLLRSSGYKTMEASSGELALQLMRSNSFDLILSDWNMPGLTGTQFVSAIRTKDSVIPVIMVTAEANRECFMEMKRIGISGYILKPFKPQTILDLVDKIFAEPKKS